MTIFKYKIKFYSDYSGQEYTETGITVGENYADAMATLTSQEGYGSDHVYHVELSDMADKIVTLDELKAELSL